MAGGIIDVTPSEGGYDFQRDDGSSVFLLSTPETDDLANKISAFKSQGMLAQNAGGSSSMSDVAPNMSAAPPPGPPPPPAMSAMPPPAPEPVNAGTAGPLANVAAAEAAPPQMAPQAPPGIYDPNAAANLARMVAMRPGSAGVTQEQLQAKAAQAVEMPKGSQVTVEGATPYDEELAQQRASATEMGREAAANRTIDQRLALQQEEDGAAELQQVIQSQISPARQALQKIETGVQRDTAQYRALRNEVATGKIKPYFSGAGGAFAAVGAALASAMGAYGATLGRTNNFALDLINSAIERDVQTQMDEFARKGQAAENMYRDLVNQIGDRDQAKLALEGLQREAVKAQAAQTAARAKSAEAQNLLQEWLAKDMLREEETERKIREASYGKHTQTVSAEMAYPRAATGPTIDRKLYAETLFKALDAQGKQATTEMDIAKGQADITKTRAEAAKAQAEAEGGAPTDRREYAKTIGAVDSVKGQIERVLKEHGYEVDKTTGKIKQAEGGAGFPLDLPDPTMGVIGDTTPVTKLHSDLTALGVGFGRVANDGGEPSADLVRRLIPQYGPTYAPADLVAQLESNYQSLLEKEASIKRGATSGARAAREQETRNVNLERAAPKAGPAALPSPERF